MRYGRIYAGITDIDQVPTPVVNLNSFIHPATGTLWFKDTAGSIFPAYEASTVVGSNTTNGLNTVNADAIAITVVAVPPIIAYADGDVYNINQQIGANTGNVTLDINGIGVKSVKKLANAKELAANDLVKGTINKFIYDSGNDVFHWIGQVLDEVSTIIDIDVNFADYQPNAGTTGVIDVMYLPKGFNIESYTFKQSVEFDGGATTAAVCELANTVTNNVIFTAVDVFRAVGNAVGAMGGAETSATVLTPFAVTSKLDLELIITTDVIDNLTQGDARLRLIYNHAQPLA